MSNKMKCRDLELELGQRTLIMGILNVTPDSFSDGGAYVALEDAVQRARQMVQEGADIIDVGGESTRPGSEKVSAEEELRRVIPVIKELHRQTDVLISIDTYKAEVAKQALLAGAHIINDVWGAQADPQMGQVAAEFGCPIILMHNRPNMDYKHFIEDVVEDLQKSIQAVLASGVRREQIIVDPGIGFAKTYEHNLRLMKHLYILTELGYPVLLATSRKSMIRQTLELPAEEVKEGTAATVALGIYQGCDIVRVHDVKEMKRVAVMTDAIVRRPI